MTEKEYLVNKYSLQLSQLRQHEIWTLDFIKRYIHIDHSTVEKFVEYGLLYSFKVSRCKFYSPHDRRFTNAQIRKECLKTGLTLKYDFSSFRKDNLSLDPSLIARNVDFFGYTSIDGKNVLYYGIYYYRDLLDKQELRRLEKLLIDIADNNFYSDYTFVYICTPFRENRELIKIFLKNSSKLIPYYIGGHLSYKVLFHQSNIYDYLQL